MTREEFEKMVAEDESLRALEIGFKNNMKSLGATDEEIEKVIMQTRDMAVNKDLDFDLHSMLFGK